MLKLLMVFVGGGLGSMLRYGAGCLIKTPNAQANPLGTLAANLLSVLVLGFTIYVFGNKLTLSAHLKLLLVTGFCGGLSTFSTFSYETFELLRTGHVYWAIANIFV
ncbi:MAG: fluoride efflux transporter CrcB [Bacteroidales bacterium]|nr:fluoride efflux transporter CrcB [Bacteroidales bacterium]